MRTATVVIDGAEYTLAPIRNKDARELPDPSKPLVKDLARLCFIAGGQTAEQWDNLPLFADYSEVFKAALDLNGLTPAKGEAPAPQEEGTAAA